uniref:Lycosin 4z 7a n=1 Tax=Lycosa praegrandis TaxID=2066575 RepID=A0A8D7ZRE7_LYCPR|nr:Lycosin 4z 7a precursor [Lycosa praegrandis]
MNYTAIAFLLLVALTCSTARSIDASEEKVQEIREEIPSSNEDESFSLSVNVDEETRGKLAALLAKLKAYAAQSMGREESSSGDEEREVDWMKILQNMNDNAAKNKGREERKPLCR